MLGKVIRGTDHGRLLYYLYGPGKANEHTDPHLVAGFSDPADLEPERRPDGARDFRRLTGLLAQPLAGLARPGYAKPVWHCSVRAAPGDRMLSDAEWAQVAATVMDRTGLAPAGDDLGVRWVAVRHAADHIHLVATLARQDGTRPGIWNDFKKVRAACLEVEERFGLTGTAPADRTAARRPARAETEQAARRGWSEPPRVTLRREVSTAAAGARTEDEFFTSLARAGVLVRRRYSTQNPGQVTGYAVGLPQHTAKNGQAVWFGGGKLAADLTLPKLRARWADPQSRDPLAGAAGPAVRAVFRSTVAAAAEQAAGEMEFFARLRSAGVLVRERFSESNPGEVTGYSVALPGCTGPDGAPRWYGGGRLHGTLTLPRLRQGWAAGGQREAGRSGAFRFTAPERAEMYRHAARQAAAAAEHLRHCTATDPGDGADAARAAADTLHTAARATGHPGLRRAAYGYDRAPRPPHRQVPCRSREGTGCGLRRGCSRCPAAAAGMPRGGPLCWPGTCPRWWTKPGGGWPGEPPDRRER
ncbi:MAG: relaxase/mobilization nuclease domain-containing protein [Streptosporangiaceae bacterium]